MVIREGRHLRSKSLNRLGHHVGVEAVQIAVKTVVGVDSIVAADIGGSDRDVIRVGTRDRHLQVIGLIDKQSIGIDVEYRKGQCIND